MKNIPKLGSKLTKGHIEFLETFSKSCRHSIVSMTTNAASGHPGGSLSCIDYLSILYSFVIGNSGEPVVVSNGHISPAIYSVLAEMGYIPKKKVVEGFRKAGSVYEGHITRHVPGVWYGTGPLGAGISAASGFALSKKLQKQNGKVFALIGDGESEEGQVYEMMNFAAKYKLDNFIVFMDYNQVQLTDSLKKIMPIDFKKIFIAGGWKVIDVDGHNYQDIWSKLAEAHNVKDKPALLLGHTIMGKGVPFMESEGKKRKATWHGKAAKPEEAKEILKDLELTKEEKKTLDTFRKRFVKWKPKQHKNEIKIKTGTPRVYKKNELTDCRSAYGQALLDLAKQNKSVVALTADVAGSVKTDFVKKEIPSRHIECGIAEQHMVSCSGGLSLSGMVPFCSTFGAFMTSRAKDQARVNDINRANVKMVSTHCGLSVGEDGPTHQAIDDMGSMLGLFNTQVIEPADPNQCDRIIRFVAKTYGNFYVRMGRHKIPVLTKTDGSIFFDKNYKYEYGKTDVLRRGKDITVAASGPMVHEALEAYEILKDKNISAEIVIMSSPKKFDSTIFSSIKKTKHVVTVEDHNTRSGFGSQLGRELTLKNISIKSFYMMGIEEYQLSGTWKDLYKAAGIDSSSIAKKVVKILNK